MWFVTINGNLWVFKSAELAMYVMEQALRYKREEESRSTLARINPLRITLVRKAA